MAISILDQVKIPAQVVVPLLKAFQEEFANAVARQGLDGWSHEVGQKMNARVTGSPTEKTSKVIDLIQR